MSANAASEPGGGVFDRFLKRWDLTKDGASFATRSSDLLPVRDRAGRAAMLKISAEPEEKRGHLLMTWWDGEGAARVLTHDGDALLIERAEGTRSLGAMARGGHDDEATRILCRAVAALHAPRADPPTADLIPLDVWFRALWPAAERHGGLLARCAEAARALLAEPQDLRPLHGDIHHENVLDFGARGWLAIDPKCLIGERGFDYANLFCNPDRETALAPGRLARRVEIVSGEAGIDRVRLLNWVLAWSGLSAVWKIEDGEAESINLANAELVFADLTRG